MATREQITGLVRELHPALLDEPGVGPISAAKLLVCDPARFKERSRIRALPTAPRRNPPPPARPSATASPAAATAKQTTPSTPSP